MDDSGAIGRRGFIKAGSVAAAGAALSCGTSAAPWRALTDQEATTLAVACDHIVPPDQDPGASEAGVVTFIDRQLATRQKKDLGFWRAGIAGLDATARRRHGAPFARLPSARQVEVLRAIEKGAGDAADWRGAAPGAFFQRLRQYTMMGFYGDPRHGGNRHRVAWAMVGLPDPPIRGRLHETPPPAVAPRALAPAEAPPKARGAASRRSALVHRP
jgi:gluconate 2-dehydrogenase gamma chain